MTGMETGRMRKIYYTLHSGKNSKLLYYAAAAARRAVPGCLLRHMLGRKLSSAIRRPDRDYIMDRVDYYCKMDGDTAYDEELWRRLSVRIGDQKPTPQKVYYHDSMRYARWFAPDLRWRLEPGDVSTTLAVPSITKSRPICEGNEFSVLMKLNAVRHYIYVDDRKRWQDKKDMAVFRGGIGGERRLAKRKPFVEKFFGRPMFDIGVLDRDYPQWRTCKMTIGEHLDYKFIMALEGNDVASNLKWVMSSNSIAVMPRPRCETWFMEGRLVPNYHYIEIKPDFSDTEERMRHYIDHPDEALAIIRHAHEWVDQFRDKRREQLISLLVLDKYLSLVN